MKNIGLKYSTVLTLLSAAASLSASEPPNLNKKFPPAFQQPQSQSQQSSQQYQQQSQQQRLKPTPGMFL